MPSMPSLCPDLSTRSVLTPVTYPCCDELVQSLLDPSPRLVRLSSLRDSRYDYRFAFRCARHITRRTTYRLEQPSSFGPLAAPFVAPSRCRLHRIARKNASSLFFGTVIVVPFQVSCSCTPYKAAGKTPLPHSVSYIAAPRVLQHQQRRKRQLTRDGFARFAKPGYFFTITQRG